MSFKKIGDAFQSLGQKLSTDALELSQGLANGAIKNMNAADYGKSLASMYEMSHDALKKQGGAIFEDIESNVVEALNKATNFNDVVQVGNLAKKDGLANKLISQQHETYNKAYATVQQGVSKDIQESFLGYVKDNSKGITGKVGFGMDVAKTYFNEEGKKGVRIGTAAAGTVAGMVGVRYLDGGNLTHNSTGKRDIAGIPFV